MNIRLLIVDDHEMTRTGLRCVLDAMLMEVIEAVDGLSALEILHEQRVDIVLLDIDLPDLSGLEVLSRIKGQWPELPVLMHSSHDGFAYVERSFQLGAAGYLIKGPHAAQVVEAVRITLVDGNVWTLSQFGQGIRGGAA